MACFLPEEQFVTSQSDWLAHQQNIAMLDSCLTASCYMPGEKNTDTVLGVNTTAQIVGIHIK